MAQHKKVNGQYSQYDSEGRWLKNKIRKLESLCERFPNNLVALSRLSELKADGATCTRKKPHSKRWSPSNIVFSQSLAKLGLNGNLALVEVPPMTGNDDSAKKSRDLYAKQWAAAASHRAQNDGKWKLTKQKVKQ